MITTTISVTVACY